MTTPSIIEYDGVALIELIQTLDESIFKNIPSSSLPNPLSTSVFDLPERFLNAIIAWLENVNDIFINNISYSIYYFFKPLNKIIPNFNQKKM